MESARVQADELGHRHFYRRCAPFHSDEGSA